MSVASWVLDDLRVNTLEVLTSASLPAAGSPGQVQFNGNPLLAGDANLFWDNVNKRLGIGTSGPAYQFTVRNSASSNLGFDCGGPGSIQQAFLIFADNSTEKWYLGKQNDNSLAIFDIAAGAATRLQIFTGGLFKILNGDVALQNLIATYNNIATVSNGVPAEYAKVDLTGQTANIGATTLYTVPASGVGMYRVSAYVVETTAASVSSTLPNVQIVYTDNDTNTVVTMDATPIFGAAGIGQTGPLTANTVGTASAGVIVINAKAGTTIQYQTVNYASTAAGMAYAIHLKLEVL
jgi:hypothetical protein